MSKPYLFRSLGLASMFFQIACPYTVESQHNPNVIHCGGKPGAAFAAPLAMTTDCWEGAAPVSLVLRGRLPEPGEHTELRVEGEGAEGRFTGTLSVSENYLCVIALKLGGEDLACVGHAINTVSHELMCSRDGDATQSCTVSLETPEEWRSYHPHNAFRKYIDEHPER